MINVNIPITICDALHEFNKEMESNKMKNQISREKLVEYLNERIEERSKSNETYTTKGKYYHINEAAISTFKSVLFLVDKGMFDEELI